MRNKTSTISKTQISFTANPALKDKALEKAKSEGITLKALFIMAMKSYVNNDLTLNLRQRDNYYDELFADKEVAAKANKLGKLLDKTSI